MSSQRLSYSEHRLSDPDPYRKDPYDYSRRPEPRDNAYRPDPRDYPSQRPEPRDSPAYRSDPRDPHGYPSDPRDAPGYRSDPRDAPGYRSDPRDAPGYRSDPRDAPGYRSDSRYDTREPYRADTRDQPSYRDDPYNKGRIDHYDDRSREGPYDRSRDEGKGKGKEPPGGDDRLPPQDNTRREDPYTRSASSDKHSNGSLPHRDDHYKTTENDRGNTPYELDHLATFTVGSKQGLLSPEDGMKKLRQMELSTGIWTMRVQMLIESKELVIIDRSSGDEMERFSLGLVHEPTAVTNSDRSDIYNNVVLFTVMEDPQRQAPREMHIFQCISKAAHTVVDDIKSFKSGRSQRSLPPSYNDDMVDGRRAPVPDRIKQYEEAAQVSAAATDDYKPGPAPGAMFRKSMTQEDNESVLSERTDKDVQLLNHCFDDIEKFVGRLQEAANSYKELDARRKTRDKKSKNKDKEHGDGMLSMRARPPPAREFIDTFQKFKLAFNLLAKLKPHIHDPNAPELVHFLFTPLSLVVEASKNPRHGTPDLASKVVAPLLTSGAKDLLQNCLTSKEHDLWASMGDSWMIPRDQWKSYVSPYFPKFSDGWQPSSASLDEGSQASMAAAVAAHSEQIFRRNEKETAVREAEEHVLDYPRREEQRNQEVHRRPEEDRRDHEREREMERREVEQTSPRHSRPGSGGSRGHDDQDFVRELKSRGAKIFEVIHEREGRNSKELSVKRGDILELVDDTRKWWKLRNSRGQVGHAPYTILSPYGSGGEAMKQKPGSSQSEREEVGPSSPYKYAPPPDNQKGGAISSSSPGGAARRDDLLSRGKTKPAPADVKTAGYDEVDQTRSPFHGDPNKVMRQASNRGPIVKRSSSGPLLGAGSPSTQVQYWLKAKGFSPEVQRRLEDMSGIQLFQLQQSTLDYLCGAEEGHRLSSLLRVQKQLSQYEGDKSTELEDVLKQRKRQAEIYS